MSRRYRANRLHSTIGYWGKTLTGKQIANSE